MTTPQKVKELENEIIRLKERMSKRVRGKLLAEFVDGYNHTYAVIDYGDIVEVCLVLTNYSKKDRDIIIEDDHDFTVLSNPIPGIHVGKCLKSRRSEKRVVVQAIEKDGTIVIRAEDSKYLRDVKPGNLWKYYYDASDITSANPHLAVDNKAEDT